MRLIITYVLGLIFGVGISISGMANPAKVVNFFDFAGSWDPSLAFVMGGALGVALIGYKMAFRREAPLFDTGFHVPSHTVVDRKLVLGSATFGIGWGIAGFCPGGALPALGTGDSAVFIFSAAMVAGILIAKYWLARSAQAPTAKAV